jgi:hypothetical protein
LTASAGPSAVLGKHARHGREKTTEPPSNPMSQDDAQQLIEGLLVRWLETRGHDDDPGRTESAVLGHGRDTIRDRDRAAAMKEAD